jgi:hypothetical protein
MEGMKSHSVKNDSIKFTHAVFELIWINFRKNFEKNGVTKSNYGRLILIEVNL